MGDVFAALFGETISPTGAELRYRLCDLIEHGGKKDVGVAALREIVADLERDHPEWRGLGGGYAYACDYAAHRIRKAIKGAQTVMPSAEDAGTVSIRANVRQCEREAAADWVEKHGALEAIENHARMLNGVDSIIAGDDQACFGVPGAEGENDLFGVIAERLRGLVKMDEFVASLATEIGVGDDVGDGDELRDAIKAELDKRLMPCDLATWESGERVLRAKHAVLGADGIPIDRNQLLPHVRARFKERIMRELRSVGGEVVAVYYESSDMPPCRKCGVQPVVKGGRESQRLECPECGIRTRQSTSGPDYETWMAVMGGDAE